LICVGPALAHGVQTEIPGGTVSIQNLWDNSVSGQNADWTKTDTDLKHCHTQHRVFNLIGREFGANYTARNLCSCHVAFLDSKWVFFDPGLT
jgi:hypothetical protein